MNILLIEDEDNFIDRLKKDAAQHGITVVTPIEVSLDAKFNEDGPIEDQIVQRLGDIQKSRNIDLVLLDTDISKLGNGIGQAACRAACQVLGVPVARYTKKQSQTQIAHLKYLQRLAVEGASAIWVPADMTKGDLSSTGLFPWLKGVGAGFAHLKSYLETHKDVLDRSLGPAGILALALDRPSLRSDLLGYTAQNFFFFSPTVDDSENKVADDSAQLATRLGYWLYNCVLTFPGPILAAKAAAAYLNVTVDTFKLPAVQSLVTKARYGGPFSEVEEYYWTEDLLEIIEECGGDIAESESLKDLEILRVDEAHPESSAYFCVLTHEPIARSIASSNPDWIPSGAQVTRINQELYDQLGPMLSI